MAKGQKKTVSILLPEELYQELSRQAEASSRSLSSYIRVVLTAHLEYLRRFRKLCGGREVFYFPKRVDNG